MVRRKLTLEDVKVELNVEYEEMGVRGNAIASGDNAEDRRIEDEIIERLNSGDVWAWCQVEIVVTWSGLTGADYLGGCSYADEADFKRGGYYEDMVSVALDDLNAEIERLSVKLDALNV